MKSVNALIKLDQTEGPVRSLLQVTAQRLERNPAHAFKNNLAIYAVTLIVLFGLGFLTWYEKIDSDALMVLVGLVLGILSNYVKGIFRTN